LKGEKTFEGSILGLLTDAAPTADIRNWNETAELEMDYNR
jgi:hypothetical protein